MNEDLPYQRSKNAGNGLVIALIISVGIAGFFAGMYFSDSNEPITYSDTITKSEFEQAISKIESKIDNIQSSPNIPKPVKISLDDDPVRGDANAPITILEFSDFQCPFCARFHTQTLPSLLEIYIDTGKVNFVYRDFPIQSIHPNALPAAVAAECADEQGKFWQYHDMLFENQESWSGLGNTQAVTMFKQYASELELVQETFDNCLESGKYLDEVRKDLDDGRAYDVTGTPGFFIGNEKIGFVKLNGAQPLEAFQQVIESQLNS